MKIKDKPQKKPVTRDEVIEIAKNTKHLANLDLSRIDLSELDLSDCDFTKSNLDYGWFRGTNFDRAILKGTSFRNAMLDYSSFRSVIGSKANFPGSHIKQSNFNGANLQFSSFVRSTIIETPFENAVFTKVNFAGALIQQCSLFQTNLSEIKGWRIWAVGSKFTEVNFTSAVVKGSIFENCSFSDCNWQGADLSRVQISSCIYDHNELKKAKLEGAAIMRSGEHISVFISHTGEDKVFARKLAEDLKKSGVDVWLDEWKIKVGHSITEKINEALDNSNYIVVIFSEKFFQKSWPMRELRTAMMRQSSTGTNFILPVKIDDSPMPSLIADIAYADFRTDYEIAFEQLLSGLFEG